MSEAESIDAILRAHRGTVLRYAMRTCITPADAEDAVQETLLALARQVEALRGVVRLSGWLFTVTRNHCTRLARRTLRHRLGLDPDTQAGDADVELELSTDQLRQIFRDVLFGLDEAEREILVRRDLLEQPAAQVAADLGLTVAAVKSRLHRARRQVRTRLLTALQLP